jgi:hypothetical protein
MKNNKFQMNRQNLPFLIRKLEGLLDDAPVWTITWSKPKDFRSDAQNRRLWQFFTDFAAHVGYERKEVETLKEMVTLEVWPRMVMLPDGSTTKIPPRTSGMDTKEFSDMMEALVKYAAELGFVWVAEHE